jgi:DNA-binding NtrC family response regulator
MNESQNILFVDSDPNMCEVFHIRLRQHGHTVTLVSYPDEAISLMHRHMNAYNLIITDLHFLDKKNGINVIEEGYIFQVKGQFWLVSSSLTEHEAQLAYRAGAKIVINKTELDSRLQKEGFLPY